MHSELVSVIIPTFNRAEYLRAAIASVLAQTYTNFELLILDNCSPDNTTDVVMSFHDDRIKYLRHQCNIGPTANWTYGICLAKGIFLSILGDDDYYAPEFLERRVKIMIANQNIVSAFGEYEYLSEKTGEKWLAQTLSIQPNSSTHVILSGPQGFHAVMSAQFVGATLYRTNAVQAKWQKAITGGKCMDALLNAILAMIENVSVAFLFQPDYVYRRHDQQDSSSGFLEVAEDGGRAYLDLLHHCHNKAFSKIIRNSLVDHWNRNARICWDSGNKSFAQIFFVNELKINPLRFKTWLRLLRCYAI